MRFKILELLLIVLAAAFSSSLVAVELKSGAFLGVRGAPGETELAGVLVADVAPQGTAAKLGVMANDRIIKINNQSVANFSALGPLLRDIRAGDPIKIELEREGKLTTLAGTAQGRSREQGDSFDVVYDAVQVGDDYLRSIIYKPKGLSANQKLPAVYFIQGYTCNSVDYAPFPELTIRQALVSFVKQGYIVYRQEKFGIGDSVGPRHCSQVTFTEELDGFKSGLDHLKQHENVQSENIHLFGHSLGGLYAPLLAQDKAVKSIIAYGAVVKPWYEYLQDIYSEQALMFGTDKQTAKSNRKLVQPLLYAWLKTDRSLEEIYADPKLKQAVDANLVPRTDDQVFHRHYTFFRDMNKIDFIQAWQNISVPVLAIHGSLDIQAINESWTQDVMQAVNRGGRNLAKRTIIKGAEHGLMRYDSLQQLVEAMQAGQHSAITPGERYESAIAERIIAWLKEVG